MYYISSIFFFHQIFVPSEILKHFYIYIPFFHTSKFDLFDLRNPKIHI